MWQVEFRTLAVESILDPVRISNRVSRRAYGNHVEAAWMSCPACLLLQEKLGGLDQFLLFAQVDAFQCATPCSVASVANLDKYYCIAIKHDQIKLPASACPVLTQRAQSLLLQIALRQVFSKLPACLLAAWNQLEVSGRGCTAPSWNSAQGKRRWTLCAGVMLSVPDNPSSSVSGKAKSWFRRVAS